MKYSEDHRQHLTALAVKYMDTQDRDALEELFAKSRAMTTYIYNVKVSKTTRTHWTADDLYSETCMKMKILLDDKKFDKSRGDYAFYLFMVCKGVLYTHLNSEVNSRHAALSYSVGPAEFEDGEAMTWGEQSYKEDYLGNMANKEEVVSLIKDLCPTLSVIEIFTLYHYMRGDEYKTIAENVGDFLNKNKEYNPDNPHGRIDYKSIDNALGRIKLKAARLLEKRRCATV